MHYWGFGDASDRRSSRSLLRHMCSQPQLLLRKSSPSFTAFIQGTTGSLLSLSLSLSLHAAAQLMFINSPSRFIFSLKLFSAEIMRPTELRSCSVYPANAPHRRPLLTDGQKTNWTKHKGARFDAFWWLHNSTVSRARWSESLIWTQMTKQTSLSRSLTYSLLVRDVQLWFSVRLELVLFKSCIDPSILHDLLQKQSDTIRAQLIPDLQTSISILHTCVCT